MTHNETARIIFDQAFHIHRSIGPGMLESVYTHCLEYRLNKAGLYVKHEVPVPLIFEDVKLECGYRADLIVENLVLIEVKSVEKLIDIHFAQTLTYLKLLDLKLGLLLNFNSIRLKDGIQRVVNGL